MGRQKFTKGTGITAEARESYDGSDMEPAFRKWADQWNAARREGGGDFGAVTLELRKQAQSILDRAGPGPYPPDSQEDFAERILTHHRIAVAAINRGAADSAARYAVHIGFLLSQAYMKGRWEPHAIRGLGTQKHAKAGHAAVHGTEIQKRERWKLHCIAFDEAAQQVRGITAARSLAAERRGVSMKTIERALLRRAADSDKS